MKLSVIIVTLIIFQGVARSAGMTGAKILQISKRGRTIKIDRGEIDGIREGDKGKFIFQDKTESLNLHYIAGGEAVKVYTRFSYWYLRELKKDEYLQDGNNLIITSTTEALLGRRPLKIDKQLVVLLTGQSAQEYLSKNKEVVPDDLIKRGHEYKAYKEPPGGKNSIDHDFRVRNFTTWAPEGMTTIQGFLGELGTAHISETRAVDRDNLIRRRDRNRVFNAQVEGVVDKYNNLEYGLKSVYANVDQGAFGALSKAHSGVYHDHKEREKQGRGVSPRALAKLERDGEMWSADMDDEEIREFIITSGLAREYERVTFALENRISHELIFRFSTDLNVNTSKYDNNFNGAGRALEISYEFHMLRYFKKLSPFTIELTGRVGDDFYDMGRINVESQERSIGLGINWYILNNPSALNRYMPYVGVSYMTGEGELMGANFKESYSYQIKRIPSWRAGMKYRFRAGDEDDDLVNLGVGVNILFSYESVSVLANEQVDEDIYGTARFTDRRLAFGVSVYF